MNALVQESIRVAVVGIGATAAMDLWLLALRRAGVPGLDFALLGRWFGHLARGTWSHDAIARAAPVPAERAIGWLAHYAVGIAFAALFVAVAGLDAVRQPSLAAAAAFGIGTAIAPLFVMQPAMGAGFASARTRTPLRNSLRSLVNHAVFGVGLYLAAAAVARVAP
jgi:hypothetical protein